VEVNIEIDGASKPLYKRHPSAPRLLNVELFPALPPQRGEYRLDKYVENISHQTGIVCKPVA
jgi:hypothetical protein